MAAANPLLPPPILAEELLWEILRRVPVKSLMRCKCVSKLWRSIIVDPSNASSYIGGSRGILISQPSCVGDRLFWPTKDFFLINLYDDPDPTSPYSNCKLLSHLGTVKHVGRGRRRLGYTEAVNGLVCFFQGKYSCLYNIATRESLDLPLSHNPSRCCQYHLGFDPVRKLYKLLKVCPVYNRPIRSNEDYYEFTVEARYVRNSNCEVLTVGVDASWRIMDKRFPWRLIERSSCFNGVLYWSIEAEEKKVLAFDLDLEKFEFIRKVKRYDGAGFQQPMRGGSPQFGTALALIDIEHRKGVTIFRYDNNSGIPIGDCFSVWNRMLKFNLPAGWSKGPTFKLPSSETSEEDDNEFSLLGILPDGRLFIMGYREIYVGFRCPAIFYLYDPVKKRSTRFVILQSQSQSQSSGSRRKPREINGHFSYHEDNIISLASLTSPTSTSSSSASAAAAAAAASSQMIEN